MDAPEFRLRKWKPEHVIISNLPEAVMVDPNDPMLRLSGVYSLQLIACRNLTRRALQKFCTIDGEKES